MILPYLWNPSIKLDKEPKHDWKKLIVFHHVRSKDKDYKYQCSENTNQADGRLLKALSFNPQGEIISQIDMEYPDEHTEITLMSTMRGMNSKDVKTFNQEGFLIKHIEDSTYRGLDETSYVYDDQNRLLAVHQIEEDGEETWEKFIYQEDKLFKIETSNNDGESLFRGFLYYPDGKLEKMIRMQNELVDVEQTYLYNDLGLKIKELHESVNRRTGQKNMLMLTDYEYHSNRSLKSETFRGINSYKSQHKFDSQLKYNESGLLIESIEMDYEEESEEVQTFNYEY